MPFETFRNSETFQSSESYTLCPPALSSLYLSVFLVLSLNIPIPRGILHIAELSDMDLFK